MSADTDTLSLRFIVYVYIRNDARTIKKQIKQCERM